MMSRAKKTFLYWALALSGMWFLANLPRDGGALKRFLPWAGFPWTFAFWDCGQLKWFDPLALAADVALGFAVAIALTGLCPWSRRAPAVPADRG